MRKIVYDVETTGLECKKGDRIVEFAGVEIIDGKITGNHLHLYINPEGKLVGETENIHGLSDEFLKDKPLFRDVMPQIIEFMKDSVAIAHNGKVFDEEFVNYEMRAAESPVSFWDILAGTEDSLVIAKQIDPGSRNHKNLDALADRYEVDRSKRIKHGALIDCEILAEVYLKMTHGIDLEIVKKLEKDIPRDPVRLLKISSGGLPKIKLSENDLQEHENYLDKLQKNNIVPVERKNGKTGMKI